MSKEVQNDTCWDGLLSKTAYVKILSNSCFLGSLQQYVRLFDVFCCWERLPTYALSARREREHSQNKTHSDGRVGAVRTSKAFSR